jgi:hypothetical protein
MNYRIAVEDMEPDHWIAWVLDLPGCYSSAHTSAKAISQVPFNISRYFSWISSYESDVEIPREVIKIDVIESFKSFINPEDPNYIVNAFFEDDKHPLGYWDVVIGQRLLDWSRSELVKVIQNVDEDKLNLPIPNEVRGTISGIIDHIAGAENWYFSMLGLSLKRDILPEKSQEKLVQVRLNTKTQLWKLIGDTRIEEKRGEMWSARKILRRTLWHEQDHTQHIERLLRSI